MYFVITVAAFALIYVSLQRHITSRSQFKRYGIDPGFFGTNLKAAQQDFLENAHILMRNIYNDAKKTGNNYKLQSDDNEIIVIAPKFLSELRNLPIDGLSHPQYLINKYMGKYNGIAEGVKTTQHVDICRNQLTHSLTELVPQMKDNLDFALQNMIPLEGTELLVLTAWNLTFNCVLHMCSRAFVGSGVCRNPVWLEAMGGYPTHVVPMAHALRPYPHLVRELLKYIHPAARRVRRDVSLARQVLYPLITERLRSQESHTDCVQFLIDSKKGKVDPEQIVQQIFVLIGGALVTSIMAAVHSLYDLLSQPDYVEILRTEALTALHSTDDKWINQTLKALPKLDSFLKESLRLNAPAAANFNERVIATKGIKLSNGDHLSYGVFLETPAEAASLDADNYPNPRIFDGLRFYNLARQNQTGDADVKSNSAYDFVTIESQHNLAFGLGRHTCPGRWFAGATMKLIFATLLVEYEFRYEDPTLRKMGLEGRPKNRYVRGTILPQQSIKVEIKRRPSM